MTLVPLSAQLWYDGAWHDQPGFNREPATIRLGSPAEGARTDATQVRALLDNDDMRFSRLPTSSLYGKVGRAHPFRINVGTPYTGAANSDTVDTTSHVAPSVDAPASGLLICAWAAPSDTGSYTVPGSMTATSESSVSGMTIRGGQEVVSAGATGTRTAAFSESEDYIAASVVVPGPSSVAASVSVSSTGLQVSSASQGDWWVLFVAHRDDPATDPSAEPFPVAWLSDSDGGGWVQLADTGTIQVGDAQAEHMRMRAFAKRVQTTKLFHFIRSSSDNDPFDVSTRSLLIRIPAGDSSQWAPIATVETDGICPGQDLSGKVRHAVITGAGMLSRLGTGSQYPTVSPIRRYYESQDLVAYWPCEDGPDARLLASVTLGADAGVLRAGVTAASYGGFVGSRPLPQFGTGPSSRMLFRIPPHATGTEYHHLLMSFPGSLSDQDQLLTVFFDGGDVGNAQLRYTTSGGLRLLAFDRDGATVGDTGAVAFNVDDADVFLEVSFINDGADLDVNVKRWEIQGTDLAPVLNVWPDTFSSVNIGRSRAAHIGRDSSVSGLAAGHYAVSTNDLITFDLGSALRAFHTETAGARMARLCRDARVPIQFGIAADDATSAGDETPSMGPQPDGTLLDLLRECEAVDGGILHESAGMLGLVYRTRRSLYNQGPAATVAGTDLVEPYQPDPDGFLIRNDVTVSRIDGSSGRSVQESGPLNVGDPAESADAAGRFPVEVPLRLAFDTQPQQHAQWIRHAGTVDQPRYPNGITIDLWHQLDVDSDLAYQLAALAPGDRLVITDEPLGAPDDVSQLVLGASATLARDKWRLTLNTAPESPYRIASWEVSQLGDDEADGNLSIAQSDSATLAEDLDTTETGVDISCGAGSDWVHEVDFDINVGGERMTVTAVGSASGTFPSRTQTLTVTRSANGVAKAHSTGDTVTFFNKLYIGL
jgi:hypothetical protein